MSKNPRWLTNPAFTVSVRPKLPIDEIEEDGTALDTARPVPPQRYKSIKKAEKRLKEAEIWLSFLKKKGKVKE